MLNLFAENHIVILGLLLLGGFWAGKSISLLKLPSITGFVLGGIVMGYSVMNIIQEPMIHQLRFIEAIGLSLVALIIGGDLNNKRLHRLGRSITIITMVQALGAFLAVTLSTCWLLGIPLHTALLLGAISSATAPAATVAVVHEYKAHGPLVDTLMAIVALDDAVCVILFSIAMAISGALLSGSFHGFSWSHLGEPFYEIGGSIVFGVLVGLLVIFTLRRTKERHEIVVILLGFAFLAGEIGEIFGFSALLLNMTYGYMVANFGPKGHIMDLLQDVELPILICFFTLAGATLNLHILLENWAAATLFVAARAFGKVAGSYAGGKISHASEHVKKYLGFAMLPQAGVAIALVLAINEEYPQIAPLVTAIVLASVTVNEIIGPLGTKYAITASGEGGRHKSEAIVSHALGSEPHMDSDSFR
ncbi:MAG: cation:proton antiporter [bacterium]